MFNIVITGSHLPHINEEILALQDIANVKAQNVASKNELIELTKSADIIMTDVAEIDKDVMKNAGKLKAIIEYGIGVDNIDVEAATELGIYVCNVPDACIHEVAEHTIALMLAVAKNIFPSAKLVKEKKTWDFNVYNTLRLYGKTLGLIGYGKIGRAVGQLAKGMGLDVLVYDPYINRKDLERSGVKPKNLDDLLSTADIISIHVPCNKATYHLISEEQLSLMKQTAIIINASRGGIIDELALADALADNKFFGVGLDVMEDEPDIIESPLLKFDNVVITPHMAWKSEVAAQAVEMEAVNEARRILTGKMPKNIINKSLLEAH